MSILKAVIFDHSTLIDVPEGFQQDVLKLFGLIKQHGLKTAVLSNDIIDLAAELTRCGLPQADLYLTSEDVGKKKGAKEWVYMVCERLGVQSHELLYVGDSDRDWHTAINTAVIYLQAEWSEDAPLQKEVLHARSPRGVWVFATHFLMQPPRWEYSLDDCNICIRSLVNATTRLPGKWTNGAYGSDTFELKDIFTYSREVRIGKHSGLSTLMTHALTSLYLEGLIPQGPYIAAYPSHTPGKHDELIEDWIRPAAKLFHGWFKDDLLIRVSEAPDTSLERANKRKVTPEMQMGTVCLNPEYQKKIRGKTVILIDNFTTQGTSLDWGRNLLLAAGAEKVVLLTVGKFAYYHPAKHDTYTLKEGIRLNPNEVLTAKVSDIFKVNTLSLQRDEEAAERIKRSLKNLEVNQPFM